MTALWQRSGPAPFAGSELTLDLPAKASEAWQGIYRNGQNIGYAVRRRLVTGEGFRIEYQALLRLEMMGASRVVKTRVTSLTDRWLRLRDFHFLAISGPVSFEVEGEAAGDSLEVRFLPGERTMTVPLEGPVVLPLIRRQRRSRGVADLHDPVRAVHGAKPHRNPTDRDRIVSTRGRDSQRLGVPCLHPPWHPQARSALTLHRRS